MRKGGLGESIDRLYVATRNEGKYEELRKLIMEYLGVEVERLDVGKLEIQSDRLEDIASYSALSLYLEFGKPLIVEDAGLFVEALNGFPGQYSSYVYKTIGINGVLQLLEGKSNRRAYFKSAVALAYGGGVIISVGTVKGTISEYPRGSGGFGFDPIFIPEGSNRTFAEMALEEKNKYSHRGKAVRGLALRLREKFKV